MNIILFLLFYVCLSFAADIGIGRTNVENLPQSYAQQFTDFLISFTENAEPMEDSKKYKFTVYPSLNWEGRSYNVCFKIYRENNIFGSSCVTVNYVDEIYSRLKSMFDNGIIKIRDIPQESSDINVVLDRYPNFDRIKVSSIKGDSLLRYTPISKMQQNSGKFTVRGTLNLNTVILNEEEAGRLFRFVLENRKVEKILINLK